MDKKRTDHNKNNDIADIPNNKSQLFLQPEIYNLKQNFDTEAIELKKNLKQETYAPKKSDDFELDFKDYQSISEVSPQLNEIIRFICDNIVGREEVVKQTFYAFITGEHQLLLGRTGMAKSLLARQIFECFTNANVFEKQLTKDTMPDNLFGAYDILEMKHGRMVHNINGSVVTADFAFLDEIFDANDMLLRSLLSLLNERKLVNGEQIVESPLNSVIAASNYIRSTQMLEAVLDRFLYKCYLPENKNLYYQFSIDQIYSKNTGNVISPEYKLDLNNFKLLKQVVKTQTIKIPDYVLFLKNYILRQYIDETKKIENGYNYTISDRTAAKVQDLLRASAIINGKSAVNETDLDNLYYLICMVGKEEEKIRLQSIIDTTKRYFSQDKELLHRIFNIINIFQTIKSSKDPNSLVEHQNFVIIINKIEQSFVESSIKNRIKNFLNKMSFHPNKSRLAHILEIFQESCVLLRDIATKKETIELIEGFEKDLDVYYEIYVR